MQAIALQSGSNGNCVYVESDGVCLLVDAGISGRQAQQRLAQFGRSIGDVSAVIITHDHRDHASSMGIFHRKFGLPVYVGRAAYRAARSRCCLGRIEQVEYFRPGEQLRFGHLTVSTIPTPHDAVEAVALVIDDGRHRLGVLTDLGHPFAQLAELLGSLDAVLLESNYDPRLLAEGSYPLLLKRRIRGPGGHLSNTEAASLLRQVDSKRLQWACLAHLSEENNYPELALQTHRRVLGKSRRARCPGWPLRRRPVLPAVLIFVAE